MNDAFGNNVWVFRFRNQREARELNAELRPNKKVADWSRWFLMYGCAVVDKSFKSCPVVWAHLDHFHRDPMLVNTSNFR